MTVRELRAALAGVPDDALVTFQGNTKGEYDSEDGPDMTHTTCCGDLFEAFDRDGKGKEFVLDCAITDSEF